MAEAGVDIAGHRSKHVGELPGAEFDYVVTVCGHASERCPRVPGKAKVIHGHRVGAGAKPCGPERLGTDVGPQDVQPGAQADGEAMGTAMPPIGGYGTTYEGVGAIGAAVLCHGQCQDWQPPQAATSSSRPAIDKSLLAIGTSLARRSRVMRSNKATLHDESREANAAEEDPAETQSSLPEEFPQIAQPALPPAMYLAKMPNSEVPIRPQAGIRRSPRWI
jgi:hypothetical protein